MPVAKVRRALMLLGSLPAVAVARAGAGPSTPRGSRSAARSSRCSPGPRSPSRRRWPRSAARRRSSSSSTARASRSTATATTSASSPARSTTSPRACPSSSRRPARCPPRSLVLDGEAIALRDDGTPHPFQVTASRFGRRGGCGHPAHRPVLRPPAPRRTGPARRAAARARRRARRGSAPPRVPHGDLDAALAAGHEGVVVKALDAPYAAGRRGAGWLKVKPVHTLDLVVLAVEHGSGRRRGWLSNLHLGTRERRDARQDLQGPDRRAAALADRAPARARGRGQRMGRHASGPSSSSRSPSTASRRSTRYPGGVALRFARVLRYREDKTPAEADTLETVAPSC